MIVGNHETIILLDLYLEITIERQCLGNVFQNDIFFAFQ